MKCKPKAKRWIAVKKFDDSLNIYTSVDSASAFVKKVCPEYGVFWPHHTTGGKRSNRAFELMVNPCYDPGEIKAYLESYKPPCSLRLWIRTGSWR